MELVWPSLDRLPQYEVALKRGWSPDNVRGEAATMEHLASIAVNADGFIRGLVDREAKGSPIALADGSTVPRLPGYQRWIWDGDFCGTVGFRWRPGAETLPATCLGHIGYSVVPWKQRLGYATRALRLILPEAKAEGLRYVEITTDPDNRPSQRVIESNGGILVEEFVKPAELGGTPGLRYRIHF